MNQCCVLRNHGVKFGINRITFDLSPHIKSPLEIHIYSYKRLKNIDIVTKFSMNVYFVNVNNIAKFCYSRSIIASRYKIGPLKKICSAIIIGLKILLPRWNSTWTFLIRMWIILLDFIMIQGRITTQLLWCLCWLYKLIAESRSITTDFGKQSSFYLLSEFLPEMCWRITVSYFVLM